MQKILNEPEPFVDEMLEGILAAHPDQLRRPSTARHRPGRRADRRQGRHRHRRRIGPPAGVHGLRRPRADRRRGDRQRLRLAVERRHARGDPRDLGGRRRPVPVRQLRRRSAELRPRRGARGRRGHRGPDGPRRRRRRVRAAGPRGRAPRHRRHLLPVQGRGRAGGRGRVAGRGRRGHGARGGGHADDGRRALAVHDPGGRACRRSSCRSARWRSGWASTASRASGAVRSRPPTRSPRS